MFDIRELEARQIPVALRGEFIGEVYHLGPPDGAEWLRYGYAGAGEYRWEYACAGKGCGEPLWGDGRARVKTCPHCGATCHLGALPERPTPKHN